MEEKESKNLLVTDEEREWWSQTVLWDNRQSWSSWFQFLFFDTRHWEVRQIDRFLWGQIRVLGSQGVYTWRLIRWHNPNLADMEKYSILPFFFFICKKKKLARSLEIIVLYECDLFRSQFTIMKDILPTW